MKQFFRFLTVGVFNTILGYCVIFACMYLADMSPESSNIIGYSIGLIASYLLNKYYTFNSKQNQRYELIRFLAVFIFAYASNFLVLVVLIHTFGVHDGVSQILAGVVYITVAFIMNKYYVFKPSNDNEVRPT